LSSRVSHSILFIPYGDVAISNECGRRIILITRHVGDGNVHSLALFNTDSELEIVREAVHEMVHRAIELEGTCSGEHGVGLGKVEYLESELGQGTVGLMESLKRTSKSPTDAEGRRSEARIEECEGRRSEPRIV